MHIKIKKGLDIPIKGKPNGNIQVITASGTASEAIPRDIALNLKSFEDVKFKLLIRLGDVVKIGQPLAEDKSFPGRYFCSPAGGVIKEIRRGFKRSLLYIVIELAKAEERHHLPFLALENSNREQIVARLMEGGGFSLIRSRPFNRLADPQKMPRSIFVKAIESAPFMPDAELQVQSHEEAFQMGLNALAKLTSGNVHLVYRQGTTCKAFTEAQNVVKHTAEGPHPIGNASIHIQNIDPIRSFEDVIWTVNVHDVITIGYLIQGHFFIDRIISIAGQGILPDRVGYFKTRAGMPVSSLISGRIHNEDHLRFISGDPLMGEKVQQNDFLGYSHFVFCAIPENNQEREFLHFFRFGFEKFSFSKAYVSGHLNNAHREYDFTTNQHGEKRAFIDSSLADDVMPLPISPMLLTKAVMAEDFELAEKLGLLVVDGEDFALPTFVCPSKVEMTDIIKQGLRRYAFEVLTQ